MGTLDGISPRYLTSELKDIVDIVEHGNTYRLVLENHHSTQNIDLFVPNYPLLEKISSYPTSIISQLTKPIIAEIETGTGCNTPFCKFCIEAKRSQHVEYRSVDSIIKQIKSLYDLGVRHFRLGRQPNFFHFHYQDVNKMEHLLYGIRNACPDIQTLHIDNVNIINVISKSGKEITKKS